MHRLIFSIPFDCTFQWKYARVAPARLDLPKGVRLDLTWSNGNTPKSSRLAHAQRCSTASRLIYISESDKAWTNDDDGDETVYQMVVLVVKRGGTH